MPLAMLLSSLSRSSSLLVGTNVPHHYFSLCEHFRHVLTTASQMGVPVLSSWTHAVCMSRTSQQSPRTPGALVVIAGEVARMLARGWADLAAALLEGISVRFADLFLTRFRMRRDERAARMERGC